ncbi:MAG: hypothetical protein RBT36_05330 [Desulfobulbus sp.]|nr:hypothetical protein [Desulfobulbus sp.]
MKKIVPTKRLAFDILMRKEMKKTALSLASASLLLCGLAPAQATETATSFTEAFT